MSHPYPVSATPVDLFVPLTPVQGRALAGLLTALNPKWRHEDVYANIGAVVAEGVGDAVTVCVAGILAACSPGGPSTIRFPGAHWDAARAL